MIVGSFVILYQLCTADVSCPALNTVWFSISRLTFSWAELPEQQSFRLTWFNGLLFGGSLVTWLCSPFFLASAESGFSIRNYYCRCSELLSKRGSKALLLVCGVMVCKCRFPATWATVCRQSYFLCYILLVSEISFVSLDKLPNKHSDDDGTVVALHKVA